MTAPDGRAAWADYWRGAGAIRPSCLPNARSGVETGQRAVWAEVAKALPRKARVLDIGTGDGAVLAMLAGRRDLELIGVDSSPSLPPAPKGMRLLPAVAAEALPFPDARMGAIVSQFGFEYADVARAAQEAGRVLRSGGTLHLIVHHREGPIVAHNRERRDGIAQLLADGLLDRAAALVAARRFAPLPTPPAFAEAVTAVGRVYGGDSGAAEMAEGIRRILEAGRGRPPEEAAAMLATIRARAEAEVTRVDCLLAAARDEAGMADLAEDLEAAGIDVAPAIPLFEGTGSTPFAWRIEGRRR